MYFYKKNEMKKILVFFIYIITISKFCYAQYEIPSKMNWWYEARFGMFIHFGSYSEYGHGEWVMFLENWTKKDYQEKITKLFNPVNFNAQEIVSIAKSTGMKYIVITAKHHEGFSMWKTNVSGFRDYTGNTIYDLYHYCNFKRDLLMELKQECDKQGIQFCLYYSILDWGHISQTHKDYFSEMTSMGTKKTYVKQMKAQLKELITRYDPAVIWFDGDWCKDLNPPTLFDWWNKKDAEELYAYVIQLKPNIIVNERVKRDCNLGDFMCPEQKIPPQALPRQWETCQTMNGTWGYNSKSENSYNPASTFIHELEQIVSRDGNYLLNIDPKGDGSLNPMMITILNQCGIWMKTYGESIYGCTRNPYPTEPEWGFITKKAETLYLHIHTWPSNGQLKIHTLPNDIMRIYDIADKSKNLDYTIDTDITITLPKIPKDTISNVIAIEFKNTIENIQEK